MQTLSTVLLIKVVQHNRRSRRLRGRPSSSTVVSRDLVGTELWTWLDVAGLVYDKNFDDDVR